MDFDDTLYEPFLYCIYLQNKIVQNVYAANKFKNGLVII